ncbi:Udp-glycosyltransferase 91c1 [Thalictrum thalictroides]|uniref:Udp-glycosyltransferase 91c1 n=1 Tax=Thalictrum thalictroides TaxID=46969 RepID=A0A7J6UQQ8_THATH|nr:Udp-glycosyltransferase 91c1 [Thalictrum thalictroides]
MEGEPKLHIVMFPWLAFGHMLPFLEFSKCLAQKGHHISFISTPKNLQRLPKIPHTLASSLKLIPIPFLCNPNLPPNAESTADITPDQGKLLMEALDSLQDPLTSFLEESRPDWIFCDFAPYWLPPIAAKLNIPYIYFNIFNASMLCFYGSVLEMMSGDLRSRLTPEDYMVPPKWVPFPSNLALRSHEAASFGKNSEPKSKSLSNLYRMGAVIQGSEFMAVRSCTEFEGEWLRLLEEEVCLKPVIPVGLLPPPPPTAHDSNDENWVPIKNWLDKQAEGSVVYIAFGSESAPNQDQVAELAHGLEMSKLPFFWVVRKPPAYQSEMFLPIGFEDRVKDRGYVSMAWVPQLSILTHRSVGGFLTHGGWSSIIEGLKFGLALTLLPMSQPQGLNARLLEWKKIGLEIPRDEDGSFKRDSVAGSLRTVMVEKEGEMFRTKAKEMKDIFGNKERNDQYMEEFDRYLKEYKRRS